MKKLIGLMVMTIFVSGCSLLQLQTQTETGSINERTTEGNEEVMIGDETIIPDEDELATSGAEMGVVDEETQTGIESAFAQKHPDWDMKTIKIVVKKLEGDFASGSVEPVENIGGGGIFFATKTDSGWIIVSDGNGVVMCDDIEPYEFPVSLIPECYDADSSQVIYR